MANYHTVVDSDTACLSVQGPTQQKYFIFFQFLSDCDKILFMRTGWLVEQGSHENLLESGGLYSEYYNTMVEAEPLTELHEVVCDYQDSPVPSRSEQVCIYFIHFLTTAIYLFTSIMLFR